ncbi:MAG: amino acid adenylation domain-containing protein, partial [Clostridium sp.]
PRTELERKLVEIFENVLDCPTIGIDDNFFEFGGHSLKVIKLINQIEVALGVKLKINEIFTNSTVREISNIVLSKKESVKNKIVQATKKEYYIMSSAQKRLYLMESISDNKRVYNLPFVFELDGNIDLGRLEYAINDVVYRNEVFRTSFHLIDGVPMQKIHEKVSVNLEYEIVENTNLKEILNSFVRPFNLEKAPLARFKMVKCNKKNILMIDIHHIISDGISMELICSEISKVYNGEFLLKNPIQYKDYSEWMDSVDLSSQKKYWLNEFNDEIPVLDIPLDFKRGQIQSFNGNTISKFVGKDLKKKIKKLAIETKSTEYMVLLSALSIMLSKYSRQEEIIIGSPISGRTNKDVESIIGMFVNTLALKTKPKKYKKYIEFLNEIKETSLKAFENQEYPFEELVEQLNIKRDLSRNPLFDVMFTVQDNEKEFFSFNNIKTKILDGQYNISKFDITVNVINYSDDYEISVEYCSDLFKEESIKNMINHYIIILEQILEEPQKQIKDIETINEEEKNIVLYDFNNNNLKYPSEMCIHQIFEMQAEKFSNNIAVELENKSITYSELNNKANKLALLLRNKGVKQDEYVAIMSERSIEMIISIIAVLKAGGAYLPIDSSFPVDRIKYMIEDSEAKLLLTDNLFMEVGADIEKIDINDPNNYVGDGKNLLNINKPNNLAYLIYTSGTTGNPKGVMIEHKGVLNLKEYFKKTYYVDERDTVLQFANMIFDASVWEFTMALLNGAKLCLAPKELIEDTNKFELYVKNKKVSIAILPPAFYAQVDVSSISTITTGGSATNSKIVEKAKNCRYINAYGPTENTVCATHWERTSNEIPDRIPIGKPISNTKIYILNDDKLCGIGIPGELCIAGPGLARGYLKRDDLTKEKFIENPIIKGQRIYRSGDLARYLPDGNIEYLGRIDEQVKIRGYRIELGEIENELRKIDYIKDVAVIVKEQSELDKYICAYVVSDIEIDSKEIKMKLGNNLPKYMIPAYIMKIDNIPVTKSGKIDKKSLPEIDITFNTDYVAPRNELESKLANIFEDVLGIKKVGINDNFFELGGHSLNAIKIMNSIEVAFKTRLPLKELFINPTVEKLASVLANENNKGYESIKKAEDKNYYIMSSAQKRLFTIDKIIENKVAYNIPTILELNGNVEINKLKQSLIDLVKRQEILRTTFEIIDGEAIQKIVSFEELDFDIPIEVVDNINIEEIKNKYIKPFDLSKTPLIRFRIISDSEKTIVFIDMHHIVSDGISMEIIVNELSKSYNGELVKEPIVQYKDYSEWMEQRDFSKQKKYWINQFKDVPVIDLPLDYPRGKVQSFNGKIISRLLEEDITSGIRELANKTNTTEYMVYLSVLYIILYKYSRQEDIVIGTPISGRIHKDTENMIGMFVNTLPLRNRIEKNKKYLEFLTEVRDNCVNSFENQEYPFEELISDLDINRDLARNPLFDVMFILQNEEKLVLNLNGIEGSIIDCQDNISKFDISLNVIRRKDAYELSFEYCTDLFKEETISKMLNQYNLILKKIVNNPELKINDIEIITSEDKDRIINEFNNTDMYYP